MNSTQKATRIQRVFFVTGIMLAPIALGLYNVLSPFFRGNGHQAVAANLAANTSANFWHLIFGAAAGFLLPISFVGLAFLAFKRKPVMATWGGILGLLGWLPWLALIAQEIMAYEMAQLGGGNEFAKLWDSFNVNAVLISLLVIYIVCHLISAILLGVALGWTRIVPKWSGWALILTTPITVVGVLARNQIILNTAIALLAAGTWPAALAMLRQKSTESTAPATKQ